MQIKLGELVQEVGTLSFVHALQLRGGQERHKCLHNSAGRVLQRCCSSRDTPSALEVWALQLLPCISDTPQQLLPRSSKQAISG